MSKEAKQIPTTIFEINDREYEVKLTLQSIKYLNGLSNGGAYELVGKVLAGDINTFENIIYAGLFHTGENIKKKDVQNAIEEKIENQEINLKYMHKTGHHLVAEHFFFEETVSDMMKQNPEVKKQLEGLLK